MSLCLTRFAAQVVAEMNQASDATTSHCLYASVSIVPQKYRIGISRQAPRLIKLNSAMTILGIGYAAVCSSALTRGSLPKAYCKPV